MTWWQCVTTLEYEAVSCLTNETVENESEMNAAVSASVMRARDYNMKMNTV